MPIQNADLSMAASGIVDEVLVKEGDEVQSGQMLIKLNGDRAQVGVAQAQADLQRAEAGLAQVKAGAREQEVATAEAALAAATANFERLAKAAVPGNIASAQAGVAQAQANLANVQEGASEAALIAAKADLMNAEAQLRNATSAFDKVKDESDIGMRPESLALEQATIAYESAKARMQDLENGATPGQIAVANAGIRQARAQLDTLQNSMPSDLAAAQAEVDRAQAQLDLVNAGARPEAIAVAEAEVAGATASLQQALVALSENELRAPFAGLIATLNTAVGQQVGPRRARGQPGRHLGVGNRDLRPDRTGRRGRPARRPGQADLRRHPRSDAAGHREPYPPHRRGQPRRHSVQSGGHTCQE